MIKHYEHYSMVIAWSPEDEVYVVNVPELPGCLTHGATYEEAVQQGQDAIDSWLSVCEEDGEPLPAPLFFEFPEIKFRAREAAAPAGGTP